MKRDRLVLPGLMTPDHPKLDQRVFARPDGRVELVLEDLAPLEKSVPDYFVLISTEYGPDVTLQATVRTGNVVSIRNEDSGTQKFILRVGPPCIEFYPGTYQVRAMVNDQEVYSKSLTVLPHPAAIRRKLLSQDPGEIV